MPAKKTSLHSQPSQPTSGEAAKNPGLSRSVSKDKQRELVPDENRSLTKDRSQLHPASKKEQKAKKALKYATASPDEVGTKRTLTVTPLQIHATPHLKNWLRWSGLKDALKLTRIAKAETPSLLPQRIDSVLTLEPRADQHWILEDYALVEQSKLPKTVFNNPDSMTSDYCRLDLVDKQATKQITKAKRQAWLPKDCLPQYTDAFVRKVGAELCKLLNHSPLSEPSVKPSNVTGQLLALVAVHRANGERDEIGSLITRDLFAMKAFIAFNVAFEPARNAYQFRLQTYNPSLDAQDDNTRIRIKVDDVTRTRGIPAIPVHLVPLLPDVTNRGAAYDKLSEENKARHERAVNLCRYVQYVMFGACGEKDTLFTQANSIASLYKQTKDAKEAGNVKNLSALYDHQQLFGTLKLDKMVKIRPSIRAGRDINGPYMPEIHVLGHSKARVSTALECGTQAFLSGKNYLDSFQDAVIKADSINMTPNDRSFIHGCEHASTDRLCNVHVCQSCNGITFCGDMVFASDTELRVCPECGSKDLSPEVNSYVATDRERWGGPTDRKGRKFRAKLLNALKQDQEPGSTAAMSLRERQKIADDFASRLLDSSDETWRDEFFEGRKRADSMLLLPDAGARSATRTSAFLASPDASTPFHVEGGKVTYHNENSIVATAAYANQGTNTWLKGNLLVVKDALSAGMSQDPSAIKAINDRFDNLWAIRSQYPWLRKARLNIQMKDHEFKRCRNEWRNGILQANEDPIPFTIHYRNLNDPRWKQSDKNRINTLVAEMQGYFSANTIPLPRGKDDSPFPWRPEHMPADWSWAKLEAHMAYHFELMDDWCDWQFITDESPETLLLELIWQWMENAGRDPWLRLPMTLLAHHPAGWAIGHIHHGLPMRTRWPTGTVITQIDQRDDRQLNVVIEPRIANYMKMDYPEVEYQRIIQDLLTVKDRTDWFIKPGGSVPTIEVVEDSTQALKRSKQWVRKDTTLGNDEELALVDPSDVESDYEDTYDEQEGTEDLEGEGKSNASDTEA